MLDAVIETYVKEKLAEAYSGIDDDQIIVQFPTVVIMPPIAKRGASSYAELLTVQIIILNAEKLDRSEFVKLMPRKILNFSGVMTEQKFIKVEQKDYIEIVKAKGIIFTIQYKYDVTI